MVALDIYKGIHMPLYMHMHVLCTNVDCYSDYSVGTRAVVTTVVATTVALVVVTTVISTLATTVATASNKL